MSRRPRFGRRGPNLTVVGAAGIAVLLILVLTVLFVTRKHPPPPHHPDVVAVIVSGAPSSYQHTDFGSLLKYAKNKADILVVTSARHPEVAQSISLAATGINNLQRQQNQAKAERIANQLYDSAAAPGGNVDYQQAFDTINSIVHTIPHVHVWVAALGPVTGVAEGVNLENPLTRGDPALSISGIPGGFVSSCSGWDLNFVTEGAQPSSLAEDQDREYWRRLMRSCGGRLTSWTIYPEEFPSTNEVPAWNGAGTCGLTYELQGKTLFDTNEYQVRPSANQTLYRILEQVNGAGQPRLRIDGYTDSQGPAEYNKTLSKNRAQAVADWFLAQGVSPARVTAEGFGEAGPVASNSTAAGRQLNRRVDITLLYQNCSPE